MTSKQNIKELKGSQPDIQSKGNINSSTILKKKDIDNEEENKSDVFSDTKSIISQKNEISSLPKRQSAEIKRLSLRKTNPSSEFSALKLKTISYNHLMEEPLRSILKEGLVHLIKSK